MLKLNLKILLTIITMLTVNSCREVHVFEGRSVILNKTIDTTLNDSILIYGHVYSAEDNKTPQTTARIWAEESAKESFSDNSGSYSLKLPDGIYTIKCLGRYSNPHEILIVDNTRLLPNEKIEIDFYLGIPLNDKIQKVIAISPPPL